MGSLGCFPQAKPATTELHYTTYSTCWVFTCFHNPQNSTKNHRILKVYTDASDCTWWCLDTIRYSALKADSERKNPLPHQRIEPMSVACRSTTLPTELHPCPNSFVCLCFDELCFALVQHSILIGHSPPVAHLLMYTPSSKYVPAPPTQHLCHS